MTTPTPQEQPDGHTKGLWMAAAKPSYLGWPIVSSPSGRMICDVTHVSHGPIDPKVAGDDAFNRESRANGRLIAAAPELLGALKLALEHIQHQAAWITKTNASDKPLHGYSFEALGEDMPGMRAAIAKALGQ